MISRNFGVALVVWLATIAAAAQSTAPSGPLVMRDFHLQFDPAGTFTLAGEGWSSMAGSWTLNGKEITLLNKTGLDGCATPARYTLTVDEPSVGLDVITDDCQKRRMILDRSRWLPPGIVPIAPRRQIVRTAGTAIAALKPAVTSAGDWPSFRGREASGISEPQNLPDTWNPATGANVLWKTPIPGLAH